MKKSILFNLALGIGLSASAQTNSVTPHPVNSVNKNKASLYLPNGDQPLPFSSVYSDPNIGTRNSNPVHVSTFSSISVTMTGYQSQTNSSVRNAIVMSGDGSISIANTFSAVADGAWADRGAGYNYFNGTVWQTTSPTARIETVRTGWPSIAVTNSNREHVISHNPANNQTVYNTRPVKGTGTWTQTGNAILSPSVGNLWPRLSSGGANGNSLHAISVTTPTGTFGGAIYQGQNGALCYARSTDDGVTWSSWSAPALLDTSNGFPGFPNGGDTYAIDARGDVIAYVVGKMNISSVLMKSTDNGVTWTQTLIKNFPIRNYTGQVSDTTGDAVADTLTATDGALDVVIDNNNLVHVFMGRMRVINTTANTTGAISYFPYTDGIYYWNETMLPGRPVVITGVTDFNNNGTIDLPSPSGTDLSFGVYYASMTSHPTCGVDANNNLFLVYDAILENSDDGNAKAYRNIFGMISANSGASWSNPIIIDSAWEEHVYPNIPPHFTGTCLPLTYMSDIAVGNGLSLQQSGNPDPGNQFADIMYGCLPVADFYLGVHEQNNNLFTISDNYPNPFHGSTSINISMKKASKVTLDIYSTLGAKVASTVSNEFTSGEHTLNIEGSKLASGIYFYTVKAGEFTVTKKMIIE